VTNVLVLDPGNKVGWARAEIDDLGNWSAVEHGITPLWAMVDAVGEAQDVEGFGAGKSYDVIVCEKWRLYASHAKVMIGSEFPSVQFIGAIKLICKLTGTKYVSQDAKDQAPGGVGLARLEVDYPKYYELATRPVAHDDGHDQSALAHLAAYSFRTYGPRRDA
jgi:hypothetical protein